MDRHVFIIHSPRLANYFLCYQVIGCKLQSPLFHLMGCQCPNVEDATAEKTHIGRDGFQICLDVQSFVPCEISVKTVVRCIEINAEHEGREDEHRYRLPKGFNIEDVVSSISSDGILTIQVPRATLATASIRPNTVRHIQIKHTGSVRSMVACKCENAKPS